MHLSQSRSQEAGFTLVEVVVAAFVLVVGILATLAIFASAQSTSMTSQRNEIAAREAENQLEDMRGQCYAALTMATAHPATSSDPEDPLRKVAAGRMTVQPGSPPLVEDVVSERADKASGDGCTDADHDGKVDAAVAPASTVTIGTGSSAVTADVYRFVSWRDEECPILNLSNLTGSITDLQAITNSLAGTTGSLTSIAGPGGSLVSVVLGLLTSTLNPLYAKLTPMLAPLQALLQPLQDLLAVAGQPLDLCDLPKTVDLGSFKTLDTALHTVSGSIAGLQGPVGAVGPLTFVVSNALSSAISTFYTALDSVKADAASGQAKIKSLAETATASVATLAAHPQTTHNTKRLTVAIWLRTNANAGVRVPFYATSVVSDPQDGLL
jgi:type II secretory pathway pseudopilin PulG